MQLVGKLGTGAVGGWSWIKSGWICKCVCQHDCSLYSTSINISSRAWNWNYYQALQSSLPDFFMQHNLQFIPSALDVCGGEMSWQISWKKFYIHFLFAISAIVDGVNVMRLLLLTIEQYTCLLHMWNSFLDQHIRQYLSWTSMRKDHKCL